MEPATGKETAESPSPRQRALLSKLMLSSTFSAEEADRTLVWLASPVATKERATLVIDDALTRINARDNAKKDSENRKAEYHANKANGNGEHPPRRYLNENPPANGETPESAPAPAPAPAPEAEQKIYRINGVDYHDKNEAAAAASKAIFG